MAWHEKNLRKEPFQLTREERKADPEAAAAFFECAVCDNPAVGSAACCDQCGAPTLGLLVASVRPVIARGWCAAAATTST